MMTKSKSRSVPKLPSEQAAAKLIMMGCQNSSDFLKLCAGREQFKGMERPADVPSQPTVYYDDIESWVDFFQRGREYLLSNHTIDDIPTYDELRQLCKKRQIDTKSKYKDAVRYGLINAPMNPENYYVDEFEGWDALLADKNARWWSYEQARSYMKQYDLETINDWREFCRKGLRPKGIPSIPARHYEEFVSWRHFLGAEYGRDEDEEE
ncbi:hypothetical protein [Aliidiomarina quisquiliarum]|uniref:hypothetical protein n=1 Tax=Aliidiomarina quisquiliarum TaxID=2938947 RepID=UPI00208F77B9|nr:hypothetical protein [Aliidiomarina quisquiliarum]MCO4320358.1 hypothetical protein [Aliidiomarina quisquiliarum]